MSFNFTKKTKVNNNHNEPKKTVYLNHYNATEQYEGHSPTLMSRSEFIDERLSNLVSVENQYTGHMTPQLN